MKGQLIARAQTLLKQLISNQDNKLIDQSQSLYSKYMIELEQCVSNKQKCLLRKDEIQSKIRLYNKMIQMPAELRYQVYSLSGLSIDDMIQIKKQYQTLLQLSTSLEESQGNRKQDEVSKGWDHNEKKQYLQQYQQSSQQMVNSKQQEYRTSQWIPMPFLLLSVQSFCCSLALLVLLDYFCREIL